MRHHDQLRQIKSVSASVLLRLQNICNAVFELPVADAEKLLLFEGEGEARAPVRLPLGAIAAFLARAGRVAAARANADE